MKKPNHNSDSAIFLDRDGVINVDSGYVHDIRDIILCDRVGESITKLKSLGFVLIVVSNQAGVAKGFYPEESIPRLHDAIQDLLQKEGHSTLDGFYYCPHHPQGVMPGYSMPCTCRKPNTGMIDRAVNDFKIDSSKSYLVGDKASDINCAKNAKLKASFQIRGKYATHDEADYYVENLWEVYQILSGLHPHIG